ncbi:Fimbrial protein precursor [Sodalis glossinidius str. 'morsitans']|nr:prepilin peptidase-dependent pilin [Sodalis glossinidius]CRL44148.1 Fimbrial protein precursor [Sodalis glossinidius str. 'morsitans']
MELMVVIAIIPILSAIALPDYQRYLDRAALTDMLLIASPFRLAVELCAMQQGDIDSCNAGQLDIPASHRSRYVSSVSVRQDVISLTGRQTLAGLTLVMTPETQGDGLLWQRHRGRRPSCRSVRSVIPER